MTRDVDLSELLAKQFRHFREVDGPTNAGSEPDGQERDGRLSIAEISLAVHTAASVLVGPWGVGRAS